MRVKVITIDVKFTNDELLLLISITSKVLVAGTGDGFEVLTTDTVSVRTIIEKLEIARRRLRKLNEC